MRILIAEDEPKMASHLRKGLLEASFRVDEQIRVKFRFEETAPKRGLKLGPGKYG